MTLQSFLDASSVLKLPSSAKFFQLEKVTFQSSPNASSALERPSSAKFFLWKTASFRPLHDHEALSSLVSSAKFFIDGRRRRSGVSKFLSMGDGDVLASL